MGKFQIFQISWTSKYYQEFENTEENKLTYMPIFKESISLVDKYLEEHLLERILRCNMAPFTITLPSHKDEGAGVPGGFSPLSMGLWIRL